MEGGNFLNGIGDEVLRESEAELRMKADEKYVGGSSTPPSATNSLWPVLSSLLCLSSNYASVPVGLPHSILCSLKLPLALGSKRREKS